MDFEKLEIKNGDIFVLKAKWAKEKLEDFETILKERGYKDILIIILEDGESLQQLNEEMMRAEGWVKANV